MPLPASFRVAAGTSMVVIALVLAACGAQPASPTTAPAKPTTAAATTAAATTPAATAPAAAATAPVTVAPTSAPTAAATTAPATAVATKPAAGSPTAAAAAKPAAGAISLTLLEGSEARYKAREQLAGRNLPNDVVGVTPAVTGKVVLSPTGALDSANSKIVVDLRTLKTDQTRRDNFIQGGQVLNTAQHPNAEFTIKEARGLPSPLPTSGEATFQLIGDMTVRGVTKPMTWDVTARFDGQQVAGLAKTTFMLADFNIAKPIVGSVLSIDDQMGLELDFKTTRSAA